jgi:hypothetical protein
MVALVGFILRLLASPFKSNSRLEGENAALRHQLTVLQRKVRGQGRLENRPLPNCNVRSANAVVTTVFV